MYTYIEREREVLAYYVAFIKSLALRLDGETARLLLNREPKVS